ncbi:unnamed protein product [Ilex paraguariensis]|uniref:Dynein light chain n=1 Tax=Ilex paraguariensis TaxID=185542 RepID=A0ABC8RFH5_9AQUA
MNPNPIKSQATLPPLYPNLNTPFSIFSSSLTLDMAHQTTHRRNLASSDHPKTSMEPTHKKHLKSTPLATTTSNSTTKTHQPDPTVPSSTIQNISNHFAKLYANHKALSSLKDSDGCSQLGIDTHFQAKSVDISSISDSSSTSLTKSNHQHRVNRSDLKKEITKTKVKEKEKKSIGDSDSHKEHDIKKAYVSSKTDEVKKVYKKDARKNQSDKGQDVKRTSLLMSRSQDDRLKGYHERFEVKGPSFSLAMNGGRRKSFCCSQTELADFFSCTGVKVVAVDMPPFMQIHAVDCARKTHDSLKKFTSKTLALTLKKEFDGVYGPAWHCIVGTSFGSFVTHSIGGFLYFSMDQKQYVLLFKTTVHRAN